MKLKRMIAFSGAALLALTTGAMAHSGHGVMLDATHGFMHPFGGLDHVIAMVAVGVLAAHLGGRATVLVPAAFILAMTVSGGVGYFGMTLPAVEQGIGLSVVALGMAVALGIRLPLSLSTTLVALFAVFHGNAHGTEGADAAAFLPYAFGFVLATTLLHIGGIGLGRVLNAHDTVVAVNLKRFIGAAGAVAGVVLLSS